MFLEGIGKDAIILNLLFNLKLTCAREGVCKVGIPLTAISKYVEKLEELGYSYVVYDYIKKFNEYKVIYNYNNKPIEESRKCLDCGNCKYYKEHKKMDINEFFKNKSIENEE